MGLVSGLLSNPSELLSDNDQFQSASSGPLDTIHVTDTFLSEAFPPVWLLFGAGSPSPSGFNPPGLWRTPVQSLLGGPFQSWLQRMRHPTLAAASGSEQGAGSR